MPPASLRFLLLAIALFNTGALGAQSSLETYRQTQKSLYVWLREPVLDINGTRANLIKTVHLHNIKRIYLMIGSGQWDWDQVEKGTGHDTFFDFKSHWIPSLPWYEHIDQEPQLAEFIRIMHQHGAEVYGMWYLNDGVNNFANVERSLDILESVVAYNGRYPDAAFSGLICDQEPGSVPVYDDFMSMHEAIVARRDLIAPELKLSQSIRWVWVTHDPFTLATHDYPQGSGRPLFESLLDLLDEGSLMDYFDDGLYGSSASVRQDLENHYGAGIDPVMANATPFLTYADSLGKPVDVAFETHNLGAGHTWKTYFEELQSDPISTLAVWNNYHDTFSAHSSYDGLCLHDYYGLFQSFYDTTHTPISWPNGLVDNLYPGDSNTYNTPPYIRAVSYPSNIQHNDSVTVSFAVGDVDDTDTLTPSLKINGANVTPLPSGTPNEYTYDFTVSTNPTVLEIGVSDGEHSRTHTLTLEVQGGAASGFAAWQAAHFNAGELGDPTISGANADPDQDQLSNLLEYALSQNPQAAETGGLPTQSTVTVLGKRYLQLSYTQNSDATDLSYAVEVSSDLASWSSGPAATTEVSRTDHGDGTETVVVRDLTELSGQSRFLRLKVDL